MDGDDVILDCQSTGAVSCSAIHLQQFDHDCLLQIAINSVSKLAPYKYRGRGRTDGRPPMLIFPQRKRLKHSPTQEIDDTKVKKSRTDDDD